MSKECNFCGEEYFGHDHDCPKRPALTGGQLHMPELTEGRALDALVAEKVMGLAVESLYDEDDRVRDGRFASFVSEDPARIRKLVEQGIYPPGTDPVRLVIVENRTYRYFSPSTDIAAAFEVEDAIAKRSALINMRYAEKLNEVVRGGAIADGVPLSPTDRFFAPGEPDYAGLLRLVRATPRQRCIAALKAVGAIS